MIATGGQVTLQTKPFPDTDGKSIMKRWAGILFETRNLHGVLEPTLENLDKVKDFNSWFTLSFLLDKKSMQQLIRLSQQVDDEDFQVYMDDVSMGGWYLRPDKTGISREYTVDKFTLGAFPRDFSQDMARISTRSQYISEEDQDTQQITHEPKKEDSKKHEFHYRGFSEARVPHKFTEGRKRQLEGF